MSSSAAYCRLRISLHWISAAIILWALITGTLVTLFDESSKLKAAIAEFNVSLTLIFIPVFIVRLCLAVARATSLARQLHTVQEWAACLVHGLIYLVTAVVLISGVLMMPYPFGVFGMLQFDPWLSDPQWQRFFFRLHIWSCAGLAVLLGLHVAAVIKHQLAGYPVIRRMWL
ncbi:cytochrome b [Pseudomonas sp. NPDC090202]|uniref:cytochrome b n=1 Tax=unclassified Pseudomonas TaxID=196821 RepID=UPI003830A7B4